MENKLIGKMMGAQDGAIWKNELFRFSNRGGCRVYNLLEVDPDVELEPVAKFTLDRTDVIAPHCNAVCFGSEFYEEGDEYPLLYANVYNNYAKEEDKRIGICCVYRIEKRDGEFKSTLIQIIEIGFCSDPALWRAYPDSDGPRPYGNFLVDPVGGYYYAFVMRCEELGTRYFKFNLPSARDGELDPILGARRVVLGVEDILDSFDCPYHRYVQGATFYKNKIYSTEGFSESEKNPPAIRIIDVLEKKQEKYIALADFECTVEAEMIDFYNGVCYYSDAHGSLYTVDFED